MEITAIQMGIYVSTSPAEPHSSVQGNGPLMPNYDYMVHVKGEVVWSYTLRMLCAARLLSDL